MQSISKRGVTVEHLLKLVATLGLLLVRCTEGITVSPTSASFDITSDGQEQVSMGMIEVTTANVTTSSTNATARPVVRRPTVDRAAISKCFAESDMPYFETYCFCYKVKNCQRPKAMGLFDKMEAARWEKDKNEFIALYVIYGCMFLFGIVGNSLVIYCVVRYMKREAVTNIYLAGLSAADILLVLVCLPLKVYEYVNNKWHFGEGLCYTTYFVRDMSFACSTLMLVVMSMERYLVICHPLKAQSINTPSRARRMVVIVWTVSLVFGAVLMPMVDHLHKHLAYDTGVYVCAFKSHGVYKRHLFDIYHTYKFAFVFLLPMLIMSYAYGRACFALWVSTKKMKSMQGSGSGPGEAGDKPKDEKANQDAERRIKVIKMLLAVLFVFFICWSPKLTLNLYFAWGPPISPTIRPMLPRINFYLETVAYCNSCVNPVLYALLSSQFRRAFKAALTCAKHMEPERSRGTTSQTASTAFSQTRASAVTDVSTVSTGQVKAEVAL